MLPFWLGLFMWLFLCVFPAPVISALFSAIRRRAERDSHLSTCQPEIEPHGGDGFRDKVLLTSERPSVDTAVEGHMHA